MITFYYKHMGNRVKMESGENILPPSLLMKQKIEKMILPEVIG